MIAPIVMFFVLPGLMLAVPLVARLLSARRLRMLRANGVYPEEGRESEADIERLKRAGETVFAVRCYRAVHHVSLAEAHAAILGRPKRRGLPAIFFVMILLMLIAFAAARR